MPAKNESEPLANSRREPAKTPEDRVQQMIGYADSLAEKQLLNGSASSQVITHYLKQGTTRELLELEKIRQENILLHKKQEQMDSQARAEEMMVEVLKAIKLYAGVDDDD